ncbi:MAG: hypothetical protein QOG12_1768, partial [Verrucomicrobiota bacterium]
SFSFAGFGVSLGSALFFGVGFGLGFAVGFGELLGVGVGLGLGAIVGVGDGDGIWISLRAEAVGTGAASVFASSIAVGDEAGVGRDSVAVAASLFIQTTDCKFAGVVSRLPRASARSTARCATATIATFRQKRASRGITVSLPPSWRCRLC